MTIEAQLIDRVEAGLKTITVANGYLTNAGQNVYRNLEYQTDKMAKPCFILFVVSNESSYEGSVPPCTEEQNHFLKLVIEGYSEDNERGDEAAKMRADLNKLLFSDPTFGGLAEDFEGPVKITSAPRAEGQAGFIGYALADITIFYVTATGEI